MKNTDTLKGADKELALRYKNAGRALVGNGSVKDYLMHEIGHHVQWQVIGVKANNDIGSRMSRYAAHISGYANASKSEYFAESFSALIKGEQEKLDPVYVKILNSKKKK